MSEKKDGMYIFCSDNQTWEPACHQCPLGSEKMPATEFTSQPRDVQENAGSDDRRRDETYPHRVPQTEIGHRE